MKSEKLAAVILVSIWVLITAGFTCSKNPPGARGSHNQDDKALDRSYGDFFFKNTERVDNKEIGPRVYRLENKEVICYASGIEEPGLQCKWKDTAPQ